MLRIKLSSGRALLMTLAIAVMAAATPGCDWANVGGPW